MRYFTNDKLIDRQSRIARYSTFAGLAILLGSLVSSLASTQYILLSYVSLFAGFAFAYIGAILANKWIKEPRADHALTKALKGFDNKHQLYNFLLPAAHVLLTPSGAIVFRIKPQDGHVLCNGKKWQRAWQWGRLFGGMGQEPLGDPAAELGEDIRKLKNFLATKLENAPLVPIEGYIVFTSPAVKLSIEDSDAPVVRVEDLKETLRKNKRAPVLQPKLLDELARTLDEEANAKAAK